MASSSPALSFRSSGLIGLARCFLNLLHSRSPRCFNKVGMDSHNKDLRDVRRSGQYKGLPVRDTRAARVPLYWLRARLVSLHVVSVQAHAPPTTTLERG